MNYRDAVATYHQTGAARLRDLIADRRLRGREWDKARTDYLSSSLRRRIGSRRTVPLRGGKHQLAAVRQAP
jgi:hypothetical protein